MEWKRQRRTLTTRGTGITLRRRQGAPYLATPTYQRTSDAKNSRVPDMPLKEIKGLCRKVSCEVKKKLQIFLHSSSLYFAFELILSIGIVAKTEILLGRCFNFFSKNCIGCLNNGSCLYKVFSQQSKIQLTSHIYKSFN